MRARIAPAHAFSLVGTDVAQGEECRSIFFDKSHRKKRFAVKNVFGRVHAFDHFENPGCDGAFHTVPLLRHTAAVKLQGRRRKFVRENGDAF